MRRLEIDDIRNVERRKEENSMEYRKEERKME